MIKSNCNQQNKIISNLDTFIYKFSSQSFDHLLIYLQTMSSEWNEKRIQKEIELREELFRKLNDSEKLKQEEEQARINFESSLKEEIESRFL